MKDGSELVIEKSVISPLEGNEEKTVHNHFIIEENHNKSLRIELFKMMVGQIKRAMKFAEFEEA